MSMITYHQAIDEALIEEMNRDPHVVLLGEGISGDDFRPAVAKAHPNNVIDMPVAEALIANSAIGMALAGYRPVADVLYDDFSTLAYDAIVNQASKVRFWSKGKNKVPMVLTVSSGAGTSCGSNHSQRAAGWYLNIPGIKVVVPTTAYDAKGLMKTAIRDDDVVVVSMTNIGQYLMADEVPDGTDYTAPFGQARIAREGTDVTLVCWQLAYKYAMELADELAAEGISLEVVDPRTLCPLDK